MEDKARHIAAGQPGTSNQEHRGGAFSLWDALDLAFGKSHPPDMLKSLLDSLSCLDMKTLADALHTLGEIGRRLPDGPKRGVIAYFLAKHLDDSRVEVRITAIQAVAMLTRQTFAETLTSKLVDDESIRVRVVSADALGELTISVTLQALKEALSDPSWEVRAAAVQTLGKLGEQLVIEPLQAALNDHDFSVRSAALHTLGTFKGCLPTKYLVSLAQDETNDWITRDAAVTVLERVGEHALAQPLREKLDYELEAESAQAEEEMLASNGIEKTLTTSENTKRQTKGIEHEETGRSIQQQQNQEEDIPSSSSEIEQANGTTSMKTHLGPKRRCNKPKNGWKLPLPGLRAEEKKKKYPSHWSKWREKVACRSHYLKKYGEGYFSWGKGILIVMLGILFLIGGSFLGGSILQSYAQNTQLSAPSLRPSATASSLVPTLHIVSRQNDAHLVVVSQPGSVLPGQPFSISLRAINIGLAIWTDTGDYELTCHTSDDLEPSCMGMNAMIMSHPVSSRGGASTFVVPFIAPPTPGTYILCWSMAHNSIPFGDNLCITVHVSQEHTSTS